MIQLYDTTRGLTPPASLHGVHWRTLAVEAEEALHKFLHLPPEAGVLLTNSATSAIRVALSSVVDTVVRVPERTWESVWCAVGMSGRFVDVEMEDTFTIATDLGGVAPTQRKGQYVLHDCAHVCFPGMFEGWDWGKRHEAVLSFYPTKPMGAFGGGALVAHKDAIAAWRPIAWPVSRNPRCLHAQPSTVQCWGLLQRIAEFGWPYWAYQYDLWSGVGGFLNSQGFKQCIPDHAPDFLCTPHLLSFERTPELAKLCKRAGLETGAHYPHYENWLGRKRHPKWLSVPFWCEEVLCRLQDHS